MVRTHGSHSIGLFPLLLGAALGSRRLEYILRHNRGFALRDFLPSSNDAQGIWSSYLHSGRLACRLPDERTPSIDYWTAVVLPHDQVALAWLV